jgi:hypothetical protein
MTKTRALKILGAVYIWQALAGLAVGFLIPWLYYLGWL